MRRGIRHGYKIGAKKPFIHHLVKDVNVYKKHQKQDQKNEGGVLNKEMPINISNLMLLDKKSNKPTRVGNKIMKDKKKVRISRVSEEQIDG